MSVGSDINERRNGSPCCGIRIRAVGEVGAFEGCGRPGHRRLDGACDREQRPACEEGAAIQREEVLGAHDRYMEDGAAMGVQPGNSYVQKLWICDGQGELRLLSCYRDQAQCPVTF